MNKEQDEAVRRIEAAFNRLAFVFACGFGAVCYILHKAQQVTPIADATQLLHKLDKFVDKLNTLLDRVLPLI